MNEMNKKSLIVFIFLISAGIVGLTSQANAANCGDTDYNGTTDTVCSCGDTVVGAPGYTYQLTGDLGPCSSHGLMVGADGITIDGNSHTITGDGGAGDYGVCNLGKYSDVTIENFANITNFGSGIHLITPSNNAIDNNTVSSNTTYGIYAIDTLWDETRPAGDANKNWYGVASNSDGSRLIAVVSGGLLYDSADGGETWQQSCGGDVTCDVNRAWAAVASSSDGSHLIAGASSGRLYISGDYGATWTEKQPAGAADKAWRAVAVSPDDSYMIAAVYNGLIYYSDDSGATWQQACGGDVTCDVNRAWKAVASSSGGSYMIAAVFNGLMYDSTDGGATWQQSCGGEVTCDVNKAWWSIACDSDGSHLIAGVTNGRLYVSSDYGASWTETQPAGDANRNWRSVACDSDGSHLVAGASGGGLYISDDYGANWTETRPVGDADESWNAVASDSDGSNLIAGVNNGRLYTYDNNSVFSPATIENNTVTSNTYGIYLSSFYSNTLSGNVMSGNTHNFYITGTTDAQYNNTIDITNTVEGKPIIYNYNLNGTADVHKIYSGDPADAGKGYDYVGDIGMFWCISCSYIDFLNTDLPDNNYYSVYFRNTDNSTIQNITINSGYYGIYLYSSGLSGPNTVTGNTIISDTAYGITLSDSDSNTISNNTVNLDKNTYAATYGITLSYSDSNTLSNNSLSLTHNTFYTTYGINLSNSNSNNLNYNTVYGYTASIALTGSNSNILSNNMVSISQGSAISINASTSNTLSYNLIDSNYTGVALGSYSTLNNFSHNTFSSNSKTVNFSLSDSNIFSDNIFFHNENDFGANSGNTWQDNTFLHPLNPGMIAFSEISRVKDLNDPVSFTLDMKNIDGTDCNSCGYSVSTSPSETFTPTKTDNQITGTFTVTRNGVYNLITSVTDDNNNVTQKNYPFYVGANGSKTTRYYLRGLDPTHGQGRSGVNNDGKSLYLEPPIEYEESSCLVWTQNSPDELPDFPLTANISDIDINSWYKVGAYMGGPWMGIQRISLHDTSYDANTIIPTAALYTWINEDFSGLTWPMDYPYSWYFIALKLYGGGPEWITFPEQEADADPASWAANCPGGVCQPSYVDFTYSYATTPAIKAISDENIMILSATADADDTGIISVVLEDSLTSDISIMDIVLSSPIRIDLSFAVWAPYYKEWTEEASEPGIIATHTISGFAPNNYYVVTKDAVSLGLYLSDASGQITFTAPAGSVFSIIGMDTVFQTDGDEDGRAGSHCFIATAAYGIPIAEEVMILRQFRNEYLLTNPIGRVFVDTYYKISPSIAGFIRQHPVLKKMMRESLKPLIWISRKID